MKSACGGPEQAGRTGGRFRRRGGLACTHKPCRPCCTAAAAAAAAVLVFVVAAAASRLST